MTKKLAVFIGRFSPFHNGHAEVLHRAVNNPEVGQTLVLIGSAEQPSTVKNPWDALQRLEIIKRWVYHNRFESRVMLGELYDYPYNDQLWLKEVQEKIEKCKSLAPVAPDQSVIITGSDRDASTYYLKMFPKPGFELDLVKENQEVSQLLSATSIRSLYFGQNINGHRLTNSEIDKMIGALVPPETLSFMQDFRKTDAYFRLAAEHKFLTDYKHKWSVAPFPPTFVTVDAVVVQSGHILLIKRKEENNLGGGLYALPGGFIDQTERLEDAMLRELREETRLKVPVPVLKGSIKRREIFDKPDRSLRGRTITTAYLLKLSDTAELPEVKGSDDAAWAGWVPLADVTKMRSQLFEDHYDIIMEMVGAT